MKKEKVLEILDKYEKLFLHLSNRWNHHNWMISEIRKFILQNDTEKAMRWLGFIQGCLFTRGIFTIEELRTHNRET